MSIDFFVTSLIIILLPGTGVIYTLAVGLGRGFKAGTAAALGCTLGIIPAAIASIVGLAAIFHTSAIAFQIVKYLGVIYLLYIAWSVLREGGSFKIEEDYKPVSMLRTLVAGALLNVLNPKLSLFFFAFLPQFVNVNESYATSIMVIHVAVFMLMTFIVFIGYCGCAALARDYVISRPAIMTWMKRTFAVAFCGLGLKLALTDR